MCNDKEAFGSGITFEYKVKVKILKFWLYRLVPLSVARSNRENATHGIMLSLVLPLMMFYNN